MATKKKYSFNFLTESSEGSGQTQGQQVSRNNQATGRLSDPDPVYTPRLEPLPLAQPRQSVWDKIKKFDLKGLGSSAKSGAGNFSSNLVNAIPHGLTNSFKLSNSFDNMIAKSKDPAQASYGQQQQAQTKIRNDYLTANPVKGIGGMIGEQLPQLPLWMAGEKGVLMAGKGIVNAVPKLLPYAQKFGKLPGIVQGGLRDAATFGSVVAPVQTLQQGSGFNGLLQNEKQLPGVLLGGVGVRGAGVLAKPILDPLGKGIGKAVSALRGRSVPNEVVTPPIEFPPIRTLPEGAPAEITTPQQNNILDRLTTRADTRTPGTLIPQNPTMAARIEAPQSLVPRTTAELGPPLLRNEPAMAADIENPVLARASAEVPVRAGTTVEPVIPEGLTERGVSKNIRTDTNRAAELRDSFSVDPEVYKKLGNKETLAKAQGVFDKGLEPAIIELDGLLKNMKPEAAPLVKMIADRLVAEGNLPRARELLSNAALKATESGQFGQAFRILRDADPATILSTFDKQLKKLNKEGLETYGKKWKNVDLTDEELRLIGSIEPGNQGSFDNAFEQINARIANEMPATAMEKVNAWRHISMLFTGKSNIRNVIGNTIQMSMRKIAQRTSGILQKVLLKAEDRTQGVFIKPEYRTAAKDYFETNSKELLSGPAKYQEGVKLNMLDKRVFRKSRIGEKLGLDIDVLEKTRRLNYRLLQMGDDPFFKNAYIDRIASFAQSKGIKDFKELPEEAFTIAKQEALESTYKDASIISDFINKAKHPPQDANIARKGGAVLIEAAIPFSKTPLNIVKRGIQFSPIGIANGLGMVKSSKGAAAAIDEMAKGMTGTGIIGLGYLLASKGILTGKAAEDADLREYNKNTGNAPFSVLGKFTYDWMAPASIPLTVGVEIFNALKESGDDADKMAKLVQENGKDWGQTASAFADGMIDALNASGDTVFNLSLMKGVKQLLGGQGSFMEGLAQLPQSYASQFIPSLAGQFAGSIDPLVRQTYVKGDPVASAKGTLLNKIPFASKSLPVKQTPFGSDFKKITNPVGRAASQFLSPSIIAVNQNIDPKIDAELKRLNKLGFKNQIPTIVPNYIEKTQTHPRISLTTDEATMYQKRVGELTLAAFKKAMDQSRYSSASANANKGKSEDEVRADLLANEIADAKALAKKEILKSKGL